MKSLTLAELAMHVSGSIDLFEKYHLDYYQNGEQTLINACKTENLDSTKINKELHSLESNASHFVKLDDYSIEQLIDFINLTFHSKEKEMYRAIHGQIENLLTIESYSKTIVDTLIKLEKNFSSLVVELEKHHDHEDKNFFPYIMALLEMRRTKQNTPPPHAKPIKDIIIKLKSEHKNAMVILSAIKDMVDDKVYPHRPALYSILIDNLTDFEKELHMHMHLENNILFPKCLVLGEELRNRAV